MTALIKVPLLAKEIEALMWACAEIGDRPEREPGEAADPLAVLLAAGHSREDIMAACPTVEEFAHDGFVTEPLTDLQKDILRVSVENSSWLKPYEQSGAPTGQVEEKRVLREFAKKLEVFGIEINHIPNN